MRCLLYKHRSFVAGCCKEMKKTKKNKFTNYTLFYPHQTQFTISVDKIGDGCTTGISASDRAKTVQALVSSKTKPEDLARPGHIFPLIAKTGGVLRRTGHTEAAIDLARLAGLEPAGTIVEIMNEDGTMARFRV